MNFNMQAETAHNNVAYTDEATWRGDWMNGVIIQLGVDGQDAAGVTQVKVEITGGDRPDVLVQQMDILNLRKIADHLGGQSQSATASLAVFIDFGFYNLRAGGQKELKVTVIGTAVANATVAIDVCRMNFNPALEPKRYQYFSASNFTVDNVISLYGQVASMSTDDNAVNIDFGNGNNVAIVTQSAYRAYAISGLADTPATDFGLFYNWMASAKKAQTLNINHSIASLVFVAVTTSAFAKNTVGRSTAMARLRGITPVGV